MAFNENTRVKIPAILNLTQLGYEYVSLKSDKRATPEMEQYVNEEIPFEEYREILEILNVKFEALENELHKIKAEISTKDETNDTSYDDIILNLKESWSYCQPSEDSDYDFYVVIPDGEIRPLDALGEIYMAMRGLKRKPTDILAGTMETFERRSKQLTLERTIAKRGVVLYEREG